MTERPRSADDFSERRALIVLVDGSAFFRKALADLLISEGHACAAFATFEEATEFLAEPELALLVFDLTTAGEAGIRTLRRIRAERPAVRAIVLTGQGDQGTALEALRAGANDYLAKPVHEEEFRLSLGRALAGHAADRELARLRSRDPARSAEAVAPAAANTDAELASDLAREICAAVAGVGDADRVLAQILELLGASFGAFTAALHLREPGSDVFERAAEWEAGLGRDRARLATRGLTGAAVTSGGFTSCERPAEDPRFDPEVDTARELPPEAADAALWVVPLRFRGRAVGLVRAFLPPGALPSLRTTEVVAAALSAALRSVLLYRNWRSSIDELARIRRESVGRPATLPSPPRSPDA